MIKRILVALVAAVALVGITACSPGVTDATQQAIRYSGGELDVEKFKGCQTGPTREYGDPGDKVYYYPAAQRTFTFSDDPVAKPEAGPLIVPTKDNQQMTVRGFATFQLTTDCGKLQKFHELVGKRMSADFPEGAQEDNDGGWNRFLAQYFSNPVNAIADATAVQYTWRDLYYSTTKAKEFEQTVQEKLAAEINSKIGDGVIIINAVDIQRPEPAQELLVAAQAAEKAKAEGDARVAKAEADKRVAEAETKLATQQAKTQAQCRTVHTSEECMILELAEKDQLKNLPGNGITIRQK